MDKLKAIPVELPVGLPPLQLNEIYNDDSFKLIERVPAKTVDLILEDMPYNTTACEWDVKIDLELYWKTRLRILKPTGVIVLTASQPFTSELVISNYKLFKYDITWDKNSTTGFLNANRMPLRQHEDILVFYERLATYNPQMQKGKQRYKGGKKYSNNGCYGDYNKIQKVVYDDYYPTSILQYSNAMQKQKEHPTQKPVGLFEYLIRTYTNEGDLVFDGFGGSGTTAIAAHKAKRNFIVIEKEKKYFDLAKRRLDNERKQLTML